MIATLAVAALAAAAPAPVTTQFGRSVEGRPLQMTSSGAGIDVLVVGAIHGDEPAGPRVVAELARLRAPRGVRLHLVETVNPDGLRRGTRVNARGVDLNRNFPHRWRNGPRGRFFPGPRTASEPETQAVMRVIRALRPRLTVWLHQPYGFVHATPGASPALLRAYARRVGMAVRGLPRYRGTAAVWQNATRPRDDAFLVELPGGRVGDDVIRRHAAAIRNTAGALGSTP